MSYLERVFLATEEENRQEILRAVVPVPGGSLLDLGCADGVVTMRVAKAAQVDRVVGVEFVESWAAKARANGVEVVIADLAVKLPFDDASFDVVHANQVIEHLPKTDHFLREIRRVLKPTGYAILSTNNLASWHNILSLTAGFQPPPCHVSDEFVTGNPANTFDGFAQDVEGQQHLRIFTGRALASVAAFHGLELDLDRTAGYYPLPPRVARVATRIDKRHGAFLVQRYRPGAVPARASNLTVEATRAA
ncbi:MAG: methyltransferase domain-containing protein [Solirubrobacteraceae bacterium]|nr:methyltransferase domain-containing protein [Solirubrobacteraceae bacterium]